MGYIAAKKEWHQTSIEIHLPYLSNLELFIKFKYQNLT